MSIDKGSSYNDDENLDSSIHPWHLIAHILFPFIESKRAKLRLSFASGEVRITFSSG
jgi:hypothetical protein